MIKKGSGYFASSFNGTHSSEVVQDICVEMIFVSRKNQGVLLRFMDINHMQIHTVCECD